MRELPGRAAGSGLDEGLRPLPSIAGESNLLAVGREPCAAVVAAMLRQTASVAAVRWNAPQVASPTELQRPPIGREGRIGRQADCFAGCDGISDNSCDDQRTDDPSEAPTGVRC